jgi:hypothetical protein
VPRLRFAQAPNRRGDRAAAAWPAHRADRDAVAAMGYVSERSYACLAQDTPDPSGFDRGLAPFQILVNLKAAYDALGKHESLEGLTTAVPLTIPGLRAVPSLIKPSSPSTT